MFLHRDNVAANQNGHGSGGSDGHACLCPSCELPGDYNRPSTPYLFQGGPAGSVQG